MSYSTLYDKEFTEASLKYGVDYDLLRAVAKTESSFDPKAVSSAGAVGIMQLMPSTADAYGVTDRTNAAQSIDAGAHLLSDLLNRYNGDTNKALAAYNTGSGTVGKYGITSAGQSYIDKVNANLSSMTGGGRTDGGFTGGGREVEQAGFMDGLTDMWNSVTNPLEPGGVLWWIVKILLIVVLAFLCVFFAYKSLSDGASFDVSKLIKMKG